MYGAIRRLLEATSQEVSAWGIQIFEALEEVLKIASQGTKETSQSIARSPALRAMKDWFSVKLFCGDASTKSHTFGRDAWIFGAQMIARGTGNFSNDGMFELSFGPASTLNLSDIVSKIIGRCGYEIIWKTADPGWGTSVISEVWNWQKDPLYIPAQSVLSLFPVFSGSGDCTAIVHCTHDRPK
jgi:hypothetical protein